MRKSILILIVAGAFFAGTLLIPQVATADHQDSLIFNGISNLIQVMAAFNTALLAAFDAIGTEVVDRAAGDAALQTQIDDLPNELFSCENGGQSCVVGVGVCVNQGINVCIDDVAQCSASPGTVSDEFCDSLDNDCDGEVDEDVTTTFYEDGDGDGFGNLASFVEACLQPDGFVTDNSDCDDGQASVNPAQMEICDGLDNDCDTLIDEDCLPNGVACIDPIECLSGFCADDVCSDTACNGICEAADITGFEGQCTFIASGTDPDNECAGLSCNGAGGCVSASELNCSDGIDNDDDGLTDCNDFDCDGLLCGPTGQFCSAGLCVLP